MEKPSGLCVIVCRSLPIFDRGRHLRAGVETILTTFPVGERCRRILCDEQASECGTRKIGRPLETERL
jgi:hypothetical protein